MYVTSLIFSLARFVRAMCPDHAHRWMTQWGIQLSTQWSDWWHANLICGFHRLKSGGHRAVALRRVIKKSNTGGRMKPLSWRVKKISLKSLGLSQDAAQQLLKTHWVGLRRERDVYSCSTPAMYCTVALSGEARVLDSDVKSNTGY